MFDLLLYGQYPRIDVIGNQRWHARPVSMSSGALPVGASRADGTGIYGYRLTPETDTSTHYNFVATLDDLRAGRMPRWLGRLPTCANACCR